MEQTDGERWECRNRMDLLAKCDGWIEECDARIEKDPLGEYGRLATQTREDLLRARDWLARQVSMTRRELVELMERERAGNREFGRFVVAINRRTGSLRTRMLDLIHESWSAAETSAWIGKRGMSPTDKKRALDALRAHARRKWGQPHPPDWRDIDRFLADRKTGQNYRCFDR